jgi:S1-C subfamily serine protease
MKLTRLALVTALTIALTIAAITVAGCAADDAAVQTSSTSSSTPSVPANAPDLEKDYISVVHQVLPSVVQITSGSTLGSGIVFDTQGDIVTNAHVVGQASTFQVQLANSSKTIPATLVGTYRPDDLAVIKLDQPPALLHPAHFGDSAKLQVGEIVLAMGNPLGLTGSVTSGIISATGRTVTEPAESGPGATLPNIIQTSAEVNPGNSGGALVDLAGEVIGVPTLAALEPQTSILGNSSAAPGIGFAIPSNIVTSIAGQLIAHHGHVVNSHRAELGVQVATVVDVNGQSAGVGVLRVEPGTPAAAAGIQAGDVITAINNVPVLDTSGLAEELAKLNPGQTVRITLTTPQANSRTVTVTLGQLAGS